jgi:hypothetical protein
MDFALRRYVGSSRKTVMNDKTFFTALVYSQNEIQKATLNRFCNSKRWRCKDWLTDKVDRWAEKLPTAMCRTAATTMNNVGVMALDFRAKKALLAVSEHSPISG